MLWALAAPVFADDGAFADALTWVDRLAWAADASDVAILRGQTVEPAGAFLQTLHPDHRDLVSPNDTLYAVEAEISMDPRPHVSIRQAILYRNRAARPIARVVLRVFPAGVAPTEVTGAWIGTRAVDAILSDTLLEISLPEPLPPGEDLRLLLHLEQDVPIFDARQPLASTTLHPSDTGEYGAMGNSLNLGRWLPLVMPAAPDGSFDPQPLRANSEHAMYEPASFHVVMHLPPGIDGVSSGIEIHRREEEGRTTVVAVAAAAREFAVQLGRGMKTRQTEVGATRVRVTYPRDQPEIGEDLLAHARRAVATCSDLFGPPAFSEIDVVEAPIRIALGVEYPGLVTVDVHHKHGTYRPNEGHEWTVVHEIAHQWWSAEVGNDPGRTPWLDEGLASFTTALYWIRHHGRDALARRHRQDILEPTARLKARGSPDLPADLPAWRYDLRQYSAIVYGRAALFFGVIGGEMGEAALLDGIRQYRREQRGAFARSTDLISALKAHAEDPDVIEALYRRWIVEAHGYEDLLP